LSDYKKGPIRIEGSVAPGFESVKALYVDQMQRSAEQNTQLCVYHRGERVVDLWASASGDQHFTADSVVNIFSSGKSLASIAMAWLVGKGLLAYDARVSAYWPEFVGGGKDDLTVADVLRHEGGMAAFPKALDPQDLRTESIKQNKVGELIEGLSLSFPDEDGRKREYHAVTRGWILNEIFRRVDPASRTIGEFLRDDLRGPLGADVIMGVSEAELGRVSAVKLLPAGLLLRETFKPAFLGRKTMHGAWQLFGRLAKLLPAMRHSTTRKAPPPFRGMKRVESFNEAAVAMGETPSAAANASARGLAKVAAMMAAGGTFEGREYISREGWSALHDHPQRASMGFGDSNFTQGGVNLFTHQGPEASEIDQAFNNGRVGFYGWMGFGGSVFQWNPEHEIGFAFVPTALHVLDLFNERGEAYQAEVLRCIGK
jgi:CubicO group peptidase (beta-lactamase class C family)